MRIAVAMSGGVDSSVAALILLEQGHDVFGLTMRLGQAENRESPGHSACPGDSEAASAERVASELGIEHHCVPMQSLFDRLVVSDFVREYACGRTPNPCVVCNETVKLGELLRRAEQLGADALATGHHARIRTDVPDGPLLARSLDSDKDQSYFLYRLSRSTLARIRFPVGGLHKDLVRERAREARLHVSDRPESQDVCFIAGGDTEFFLRRRSPVSLRPGPILDGEGRLVGRHRGVGLYTVGQRSGLGLSRERRTYVLAIDAARNAIVVGDEEQLYSRTLIAEDEHWVGPTPEREFRAEAKVRSAAAPASCTVSRGQSGFSVEFDEPQRALCPGQAVVLYQGDLVLGGGKITKAHPGPRV